VAATYWLDSVSGGPPFSVLIRFVGTRVGVTGQPHPVTVSSRSSGWTGSCLAAGGCPITTRAEGVNAGQWQVTATPIQELDNAHTGTETRLPRRELTAHTRIAPLVHGPGVRQLMWPALVGLGVLVGLVLQALLLARAHVDVPVATGISLGASILGYVAAKGWYLALHRQHPRTFLQAGACIQGFLVGGIGTMVLRGRGSADTGRDVPGRQHSGVVCRQWPSVGPAASSPAAASAGPPRHGGDCGPPTAGGHPPRPHPVDRSGGRPADRASTLPLVLAGPPPIPGMIFVGAIAAYTGLPAGAVPFRVDPEPPWGARSHWPRVPWCYLADVMVSVII